jgi:Homeodomain-like domain-containing protein
MAITLSNDPLVLCQPEFDSSSPIGYRLDLSEHTECLDMPKKKSPVALSAAERTTVEPLLRRGNAGARKLTRARLLLKANDGWSDEEIAVALDGGTATVGRTRQRFVEEHLGALNEQARPGAQRQWTDLQAAHVIAVACTPAPAGHSGCGRTRGARWALPPRSPTRPAAKCSKKCPPPVAAQAMVSARRACRVRGRPGGRPGPGRSARRSQAPDGQL